MAKSAPDPREVIGGKIHAITNKTLTSKLSRSEYVKLIDLIQEFSVASIAFGYTAAIRGSEKVVHDNTPKHITRDYRDTDVMRDNILAALRRLKSIV